MTPAQTPPGTDIRQAEMNYVAHLQGLEASLRDAIRLGTDSQPYTQRMMNPALGSALNAISSAVNRHYVFQRNRRYTADEISTIDSLATSQPIRTDSAENLLTDIRTYGSRFSEMTDPHAPGVEVPKALQALDDYMNSLSRTINIQKNISSLAEAGQLLTYDTAGRPPEGVKSGIFVQVKHDALKFSILYTIASSNLSRGQGQKNTVDTNDTSWVNYIGNFVSRKAQTDTDSFKLTTKEYDALIKEMIDEGLIEKRAGNKISIHKQHKIDSV